MKFIIIIIGGISGAILRYLLMAYIKHSQIISRLASPYVATPIINALVCFTFALLLCRAYYSAESSKYFILSGLLSAFTSFSIFYFEISHVNHIYGAALSVSYFLVSFSIAIIFLLLGLYLGKTAFSDNLEHVRQF